jgi:hypothetical protein
MTDKKEKRDKRFVGVLGKKLRQRSRWVGLVMACGSLVVLASVRLKNYEGWPLLLLVQA